ASASALVPRTDPGAVIGDPSTAAARAERMVLSHLVTSIDGLDHAIEADSLCVHGDNPDAVALLRAARLRLEHAGVAIAPFHPA
ncbi:MAG: LamB/YcsF family protein, partial [Gemmatimonadaceae bacterium]